MDIIIPYELNPRRFGGGVAMPWTNCVSSATAYDELVVPYARSLIEPQFDIIKFVTDFPAPMDREPVTYVKGEPEDYKVIDSSIEERWKTQGTAKEFREEQRLGNIVLKPMLNCKIFGRATPRIVQSTLSSSESRVAWSDLGAQKPGHCWHSYTSLPSVEADIVQTHIGIKSHFHHNAVALPVELTELERVMRSVKDILDTWQPSSNLVTQVVAEANAATWDIATEIGEMPETVKYIVNGLKTGILLLLRAKRDIKQNLSSGNIISDGASLWMQYRYALMPIVYGINDALDVLGMDAVQYQSFRGRQDADLFSSDIFEGYTVKSVPTVNERVFLKYKYDVDSKIHQGLQINLAATAWELFPFSFIYDWFFSVGDYLTAAFQPGVVDQSGCQSSVRCKGPLVLEGYSSEVLKIDIDYYRCQVIKPNAYIGINFDVFISFKRAMDAIALSWLMFKKNPRRG